MGECMALIQFGLELRFVDQIHEWELSFVSLKRQKSGLRRFARAAVLLAQCTIEYPYNFIRIRGELRSEKSNVYSTRNRDWDVQNSSCGRRKIPIPTKRTFDIQKSDSGNYRLLVRARAGHAH
jgi:hypothetical protein